ncbi:MAG: hypothetical protein JW702_08945 [Clostridiales bacterium]|nr:hypothetical protein [Clostridiales bacterium]
MVFFVKSLDVTELKKSNVLVTGTNQQGKSLLAMAISETLHYQGILQNWRIIVFDTVGHWKKKSSVPYFVEVKKLQKIKIPEHSIIFDISYLLPSEQRQFIEFTLLDLWNSSLDKPVKNYTLLVFEECQLIARRLRSKVSEQFMRIASVGANIGIRCLAITPSLTGIDPEYTRLSNQRYHFKLGNESNIKKKFRSFYGLDWTRVALKLDEGFFIYYLNGKLAVKHINLYESETKPKQLHLQKKQKQNNFTQYKKGFWNRLAWWYDPEGMKEAIKRRDQKLRPRVTKEINKQEEEQQQIDDEFEEDFILVIEEEDL